MSRNVTVPDAVLDLLLTTFWSWEADASVRRSRFRARSPLQPGGDPLGEFARAGFFNAGDPAGVILAWLWRTDRSAAVAAIEAYHQAIVKDSTDAPPSHADVVSALEMSMPWDFGAAEIAELCDASRKCSLA
ncbi:hypothetical protein nbrc107696_10000 [Gordonia spumicola]|uniref:Uncharacterized protein n=1 Tax=Gordonia spumicola TaxID=589161 RepID=A0A7I9V5S4_9ACTN|nr:hypothetical protein [Gordonia spumicola]GEE00554.1 hypothetical protein nbrc107696_10000 [Gordonia spumicola]